MDMLDNIRNAQGAGTEGVVGTSTIRYQLP